MAIRFKTGIPEPPRRLSRKEKVIWARILSQIENPQDLCSADGGVLLQLVEAYIQREQFAGCPPTLQTEKSYVANPDFKAWKDAGKTIIDISQQFGFSPKHRVALKDSVETDQKKTNGIPVMRRGPGRPPKKEGSRQL